VTVNVDTSRALRRPSDLGRLVEAVFQASAADESDWLEWKTDLDLGRAAGRIQVARSILGFANRNPRAAERTCEGLGYFVLGVEPGNVCGTALVDPADLDTGISPYLGGADGPAWSPHWVSHAGVHVLVVVIEPPSDGDEIATLRREGPGYRRGAIFVRKHGKTDLADDADIQMLQDRLRASAASTPELEVTVAGAVPLPWFDLSGGHEVITAWVEEQRQRLLDRARESPPSEEVTVRPGLNNLIAQSQMKAARRALDDLNRIVKPQPDTRTYDEFAAEVDEWAEELRRMAPVVLAGQMLAGDRTMVTIEVQNHTQTNLAAVEVKVHFPGDDIHGYEEPFEELTWPTPPRMLGVPKPAIAGAGVFSPSFPRIAVPNYSPSLRQTWIEDGSVNVTWHAGDLRPLGRAESDEIHLHLTSLRSSQVVRGHWTATSKTVDAVMSGEVEVRTVTTGTTTRDLINELPDPLAEDGRSDAHGA
jgi:hypothetical protein